MSSSRPVLALLVEHEGSVADDASGVASRVRRSGQLEQLDVEVAIHGMAQQPAQRMRTAGVGRLKCLAVAVEDGSPVTASRSLARASGR